MRTDRSAMRNPSSLIPRRSLCPVGSPVQGGKLDIRSATGATPGQAVNTWEGPHVTETIEPTAAGAESAPKKRGGLNAMLLADLKAMAGGMGITGAGSMKKAQLIDAIKAAQSGGGRPARTEGDAPKADTGKPRRGAAARGARTTAEGDAPADQTPASVQEPAGEERAGRKAPAERRAGRRTERSAESDAPAEAPAAESRESGSR